MMSRTILVLAVAILGTATSQHFSFGICNPDIKGIPSLDKTRVVGNWYLVKGSAVDKEELKCVASTVRHLEDSSYEIKSNFTYKNPEFPSKTMSYNAKCEDKDHPGKLLWTPGVITDPQSIWVLDTDYDNYMLSYSCLEIYKGKLEFVFVDSRTKQLGDGILEKIEKILKDKNIKAPLIDQVQECE